MALTDTVVPETGSPRRRPRESHVRGGGMAARRAVVRWAVRMARHSWRQQGLVLALLTVAVATAVGTASAAYNMTPVAGNADFGSAYYYVAFRGNDPARLEAGVAAARDWFPTIDVVAHRAVNVAGRFEPVDHRAQDPAGAFSAPLLELRAGRYPAGPGEVAVTAGTAEEFGLPIGGTAALDGTSRTVVGVVENPSDLDDEFVLLAPAERSGMTRVRVLVDGGRERLDSFHYEGDREAGSRPKGEGTMAAAMVLAVAVVALLFVALLAAAGFVVMAQRRQRQLGLLAALGATERHLRLVTVANGVVVGVVAAVLGSVIGLAGWLAAEPHIERAAGFRIDRYDVAWWVIGGGAVLAVLASTAAAWWPARVAARIPVVQALSNRPPRPRAVHRSASLAVALGGGGMTCLALAGNPFTRDQVDWADAGLVVGGIVATVAGVLLLCPLAIRAVAALADPLPIGARLPLRDLARHQARSGTALAAVTMALGIPVAVVIVAAAARDTAQSGNLPDDRLLVRAQGDGPFGRQPAVAPEVRDQIGRIGAVLGDRATVTELQVAVVPGTTGPEGTEEPPPLGLVERDDEGWAFQGLVYVATPELLRYYGLDPETTREAELIAAASGRLGLVGGVRPGAGEMGPKVQPVSGVRSIDAPYTSMPSAFVTPDGLARRGWVAAPSGQWLVDTGRPPTRQQLTAARQAAADLGLTVESRDHQSGLAGLQTGATAVGALLALGVLAMTVGLIRGETAPELRILVAAGAAARTRRALSAVTAGTLALLGALLGIGAAVTVLVAGFPIGSDALGRVPLVDVVVLVGATPAVAALAAWLLAGREPVAARTPIA